MSYDNLGKIHFVIHLVDFLFLNSVLRAEFVIPPASQTFVGPCMKCVWVIAVSLLLVFFTFI